MHSDNALKGFYSNGNREKQGRVIKKDTSMRKIIARLHVDENDPEKN